MNLTKSMWKQGLLHCFEAFWRHLHIVINQHQESDKTSAIIFVDLQSIIERKVIHD